MVTKHRGQIGWADFAALGWADGWSRPPLEMTIGLLDRPLDRGSCRARTPKGRVYLVYQCQVCTAKDKGKKGWEEGEE